MFRRPARTFSWPALLVFAGLALIGPTRHIAAQCTVVSGPTAFDPPASGLPSYLRTSANSMGISSSARRLAVRYNYGFVTYSLAAPAAPAVTSVEDFLGEDGYPKSGDGLSRTGPVSLSADGERILVPWTDETGYGTIAQAWGGESFEPGGDYLPPGYNSWGNAIAKSGSRYLAFTATMQGLYVAEVTNVAGGLGAAVKNGIPSELVLAAGTDLWSLHAVLADGRSLLVGHSAARVLVIDVTSPGATVPSISSGFVYLELPAAALGVPVGSGISAIAVAAHPVDGGLHLLVQATPSTSSATVSRVILNRINFATGGVVKVGEYEPGTDANIRQNNPGLVVLDSELMALLFHRRAAEGLTLQVRSSIDFSRNLAESIAPVMSPSALAAMAAFRSSGESVHLYVGDTSKTYSMSLNCVTAPSPAAAFLAVDVLPASGTPTRVPIGGSVFIGDQLRIKPIFTPSDVVTPLLDWRLDYDFHDGNAADSQATAMRLVNADASKMIGPALPPAELTLIGPCDPAQVPVGGSAPSPATGEGCWTSVTTNEDFGIPVGTPDFSAENPVERQLTIAFEVQNALNAGGSSVAAHAIAWKIPQQKLARSSVLPGASFADASDGSPATTGFRWYFASVPVGTAGHDVLTYRADCTGPTCSPNLQVPGDYRYWVSVPYRGGYRTPDCPGLDGATCTGSSAKTVKVTDVVLTMTAPTQVLVGTSTFNVTSTSQRATGAGPCPATSTGFTYNFCEILGGACTEGAYVSTGVVAPSAFPGTITLPTPSIGTWGLRIRYTYATGGSCVSPKTAQWPADGTWSPLTVLQAVPSIHLRNSTDTADMPKSLGFYWELTAGQTARAYADLNGVRDMNPPSGLAWAYRLAGSVQETAITVVQGSPKYGSFSVSTPGDYEVLLRGYGSDVVGQFGVTASGGGGGGGGGGGTGPPTVTSLSASPAEPSTGQAVVFSCNATQGGAPITSYDWVLDSGVTRSTTGGSTSYVYTSAGQKTYSCTANDSSGASSNQLTRTLTVTGGTTGNCVFEIKNSAGARISYDPVLRLYEATTGQSLTFEATGATGTVAWNFGNGAMAAGNPATYTYPTAGLFTVTLTALDCSVTANISIVDTTPGPAAGTLSVDRIPTTGSPTTVPDGGSVFIGDQLRIKPTFTPPDAVSPLLDWRLDYDFHEGNAADSQATPMRLINADASRTIGPALPPAELTLVGPCDPAQVPQGGSAPNPATGAGCWTSVTTNESFGVPLGTPDFSAVSPVDRQLTIAFEVQNTLSAGDSSVARHRITWKVPQQKLVSSALLSGGGLTDASDGSPATSGFRWYFASVPVGTAGGDVLTFRADCTGPTCNPNLQEPGDYRYWVSVPYRGGFRTPDCPGLDGTTCTGSPTKTVKVTDVVLTMTAPTQVLVGTSTFNVISTSQRATGAGPCPATSTGFSYNFCEILGGACTEGTYVSTGVVAPNAFPGTITLPTPSVGTWGLRIRYTYATGGSCVTPKVAQWPADGGWSPLTVLQAVPSIHLRNSTDTADIPKSLGYYWELTAGQTVRAYADLNGVRDPSPPSGLAWSYRLAGSAQETAITVVQGSPKYGLFSISTPGDYEIILRGYGSDVVGQFGVSPVGGGTPPTVTAVAFSQTAPDVDESVTVTCQASAGSWPVGNYLISFGDGESYTGPASSAAHAWTTEGTKSVTCTAFDVYGLPSAPFSALIDVGGPDVGPTVTEISVAPTILLPWTLATLTCTASAPPGRLVAGYEFDFGDASAPVNGPSNVVSHTYAAAGTYAATCRAYDVSGRSGFLERAVVVHPPTYPLHVNKVGPGSGLVYSFPTGLSCGSTCSLTLPTGNDITLHALAAAGFRFAGWSGAGCAGIGPCTLTMTDIRRVTAVFLPEAGTSMSPLTPCRVADTRTGSGMPLAAGEVREFPVVATACGVPADAIAATMNVTVTQTSAAGFVSVFPAGAETPGTQTVSFGAGRTRASSAVVLLGNGGAARVYNASAGPLHVILDISGVFR